MDLLVTADWLAENIEREDVKVLDGTWLLPADEPNLATGFIPGAQIFDIDEVADLSSPMKHMLPSKDCLLYTSPSPRDQRGSRMPSSA